MSNFIRELINNKDFKGIKQALSASPALANEGIPYDEKNTTKAHPLHRICDGVFTKQYSDEDAVKMAAIFLEFGANINGNELIEKQDTPLVAAASLHADKVALFYIENGADIHHTGCHGGTALHWAAWCGRDTVVRKLLQAGAKINKRCIDFEATPLYWAVHAIKKGNENNRHHQLACVKLLIQAGADKGIPNAEGKTIFDLVNGDDLELTELLTDDKINKST